MTPFFSVVIPLFNKENYVRETIRSVLNQSFTNFEIIVVDDGSTDKSLSVVNSIKDSRIRIFSNENKGLSFSRNFGVKKAKANFIAFLDADDLWVENYLSCIKKLISLHQDSYIFTTGFKPWYKSYNPNLNAIKNNYCKSEFIADYFKLKKNIFAYSSIVLHKDVFKKIGYFNEVVNYGEEEDFTVRCFLTYNLVYCHEPKVYYLQGQGDQLTSPNSGVNRIIPDYSKYLNENKTNRDLKNYIDFIHFKLMVLFKMERDYKLARYYKSKIDRANLTAIQLIKYYLPTNVFYMLKSMYTLIIR